MELRDDEMDGGNAECKGEEKKYWLLKEIFSSKTERYNLPDSKLTCFHLNILTNFQF